MQTIQQPPLAEGEKYGFAIGDKNGNLYHVILLPGDSDRAGWQAQMDWAKSIGGDLPTRAEQALLWQEHRNEFETEAYWSNAIEEDDADYAWCQLFSYGHQSYGHKSNGLRARAVRRLPI